MAIVTITEGCVPCGASGERAHRRLVRLCDRIDIHMLMPSLPPGRDSRPGERTSVVAARIAEVRQASAVGDDRRANRFAALLAMRAHVARWSPQACRPLEYAAQVRLALIIADPDRRDLPIVDRVREAIWLQYRT